ncbi:MAG: GxxExxY protein [Bacteroidota bacterium]
MVNQNLTGKIIERAIYLHRQLGPGLLENAYKQCLLYELTKSGLQVNSEVAMPLVYQDVKLECGYRLDLVVEKQIVLELKSVETLNDVHLAQLLTYMKLGKFELGLLMNFNVRVLKDGIRRVILSQ